MRLFSDVLNSYILYTLEVYLTILSYTNTRCPKRVASLPGVTVVIGLI